MERLSDGKTYRINDIVFEIEGQVTGEQIKPLIFRQQAGARKNGITGCFGMVKLI